MRRAARRVRLAGWLPTTCGWLVLAPVWAGSSTASLRAASQSKPHRAMALALVWYEHRMAVIFPVLFGTGCPVALRT